MKKKIFFSAIIVIAISLFALKEINVCNFSSFDQLKYSLKVFGKNPYINCAGTLSTYIINSKNKLSKFTAALSSEKTIEQIEVMGATSHRTGQEIYHGFCAGCHSSGRNGAPRFGNALQWEKISAKGMSNLIYSTKNGLNGMPPMGLCNELISIKDFVHLVKKLCHNTNTELNFGVLPYREDEIMSSNVDTSFLKSLGWATQFTLEEGLIKTINSEKKL